MQLPFDGVSRWEALRSALFDASQGAVPNHERTIAWGLALYDGTLGGPLPLPDGGVMDNPTEMCLRLVSVTPKPSNASALVASVPATPPGGSTPTARALKQLEAQITPGSTVVLVTDGIFTEHCPSGESTEQLNADVRGAVEQLHANGTATYVVSLAQAEPSTDALLRDLARSGGTGHRPYKPRQLAELRAAFNDIAARSLASCDLPLDGRLDASSMCQGQVQLGADQLACDADNGWKAPDPYTLRLTGSACERYLKADDLTLRIQLPCAAFTPLTPDGHCQDDARCGCDGAPVKGTWSSGGPTATMVVFDRSASMTEAWQGTTKTQAAIAAVNGLFSPAPAQLRAGGVFAPSERPMGCACDNNNPNHWIPGPEACCLNAIQDACGVNPLGSPDQIGITSITDYLAAVPNRAAVVMNGGSPLPLAYQRAGEALRALPSEEQLAVIVVADGQSNCGMNAQAPSGLPDLIDQTEDALAARVPTYVIGFATEPDSQKLLDALAAAGGTTKVWNPQDAAQLAQTLARLTEMKRGRCHYVLDAASSPRFLHLIARHAGKEYEIVHGAERDWNVAGRDLVLNDALCADLLAGRLSELRVQEGCTAVPTLP